MSGQRLNRQETASSDRRHKHSEQQTPPPPKKKLKVEVPVHKLQISVRQFILYLIMYAICFCHILTIFMYYYTFYHTTLYLMYIKAYDSQNMTEAFSMHY